MSIAATLDLGAAILGLFSALFFCIGVLHFKTGRAEEIATLMWGSDFAIAEELVLQKADFIAGAVLLLLSFLVQVMLKIAPGSFSDQLFDGQMIGATVSAACATAIVLVVRMANLHLRRVFLRQLQERTEGKR